MIIRKKLNRFTDAVDNDNIVLDTVHNRKLDDKIKNNSIESNQDFNLNQLKEEKGFKLNENSIESANNQAFEIDISKTKLVQSTIARTYYSKCELSCDVSCKRSLILETSIEAALDWFSASLGLSRKTSKQKHEYYMQSTEHLHNVYIRAELTIQNSCISPNESYVRDIENAVKDTYTTNDKIQNLRQVSEKYGHFYAHSLFIGGAIIKDIEHTESLSENSTSKSTRAQVDIGPNLPNNTLRARVDVDITRENVNNMKFSNSNKEQNVRTIGGDELSYDDQDPSTLKPWIESLRKPITWKIIGYKKIYPLFELLDEELQKKVLKALGPRILKSGIEVARFNGDPGEFKPHICNLTSQIYEIKNIDQCQIFASIVSKEEDNVFSLHVDFEDRNPMLPVIVVHHIQWNDSRIKKFLKKIKNYYEAKLCWIIVGVPTSFDFEQIHHPLTLASGTYSASESENLCIVEIPNCESLNFNQTCVLCTCKLEATKTIQLTQPPPVQQIKYNPQDSKIVVGTHFTPCNKSACLFAYNFEKNFVYDETILQKMSLFFCAVDGKNSSQMHNYGQMCVEWHKSGNVYCGKNTEDKKTLSMLTDSLERPILVNQLFDNCSNCQHHGFININNSGKIIYGQLNKKQLKIANRIAFLSV
ncbi:27546_t:CDS:2 [Dentiscutata erythropus]|uniref:27546_t:CDS:1 n=1 Tax=Dentiscutata erythropus TaxID=1348616 RepID=A0A9N9F021_9GLOM|nr:27546_t:CDS:2 [Dentiscutata erythropus]